MDDTSFSLIRVRRFDEVDVHVRTDYYALIEDKNADTYVISSLSSSTEDVL